MSATDILREPRGARLLLLVAPALVLLAIVAPFLRYHQYDFLRPESLMLLGGAIAIGLVIGALAWLRPDTLGPGLIAATLVFYVFNRPEARQPLLRAAAHMGVFLGDYTVALGLVCVALFLACFAVSVLFRRHLATIVAAVFGTMLVTALAFPETGGLPKVSGALPQKLADLPPVVHIILDEHAGLSGVPAGMPQTADAQRAIETTYSDFALYGRAYSRFPETRYSITSLLNGDTMPEVVGEAGSDATTFSPKDNAWFDALKAKGYAIKVYQSSWFDMCGKSTAVDTCYTYPLFSPNVLQRVPLTTNERLHALLMKLFVDPEWVQTSPLAANEAFEHFRSDLETHPHGVAYVVHLLLPHHDYFYRSDCSLNPFETWDAFLYEPDHLEQPEINAIYDRYLGQLVCVDRKLGELFASLKTLGVFDQATVIVHGDHGSRISEQPYINAAPDRIDARNMADLYATLLAIKAPGLAPGIREEPAPIQRVFAERFLGGPKAGSPEPAKVFIRTDPDTDDFATLDYDASAAPLPPDLRPTLDADNGPAALLATPFRQALR